MAEVSLMRGTDEPQKNLFRVTLRGATYDLDLTSLNRHEKEEAKRLLRMDRVSLGWLALEGDDEVPYVIAYLAIKRVNPKVDWDEISDLTIYDLDVALVREDDASPLDDSSETPSSEEEPKPKRARSSSPKASKTAP